jgi:hypothetical protein
MDKDAQELVRCNRQTGILLIFSQKRPKQTMQMSAELYNCRLGISKRGASRGQGFITAPEIDL